MNDILLSIVIPCYNVEKYIENTVISVLSQDYETIELLLINDGSTDNTKSVIDKLKNTDNRIKVFHKENGGVTSARLYGAEKAQGDFIAFVDGDDEVEPDMYSRLISNAIKESADISHCGMKRITPNKTTLYYDTRKYIIQDMTEAAGELLKGNFIEPSLCNKLFKKALFSDFFNGNIIFDNSIKMTEDLLMNYYLFIKAKKAVFEDFCGYRYIVRDNSASNRPISYNRLSDPMKVIRILLKETKRNAVLHNIVKSRYVRELIALSTADKKQDPDLITPFKKSAAKELRKNIFNILKFDGIETKLKLMAMITAFSPWLYHQIHEFYRKKTGLDKYYD